VEAGFAARRHFLDGATRRMLRRSGPPLR